MLCQNCQKEIAGDVKFCRFCGNEIVAVNQSNSGSVDRYFQNKKSVDAEEENKVANTEMLKGFGLIILGIVLTGISYSMADEGGTYHILWGISIYGLFILIRGLGYRRSTEKISEAETRESKIEKVMLQPKKSYGWIALAVFVVVIIIIVLS